MLCYFLDFLLVVFHAHEEVLINVIDIVQNKKFGVCTLC